MRILIECDELYPLYSLEQCTCEHRMAPVRDISPEQLTRWRAIMAAFWQAQHEMALATDPDHARRCRCAKLTSERCLACQE